MYLKTLGHPALRCADGTSVEGLRKKDLALLIYLCVEDAPVYARGRLAALLWETDRKRSSHSLTQAVRRLVRALPPGMLVREKEVVRWSRELPCDATALLRGEVEPEEVDDALSLYAGSFLEGFHPGGGTEDFEEWADRRRAQLRNAAMLLLECAGQDAETARDWSRALRLAEREVQIDPLWEQGHRRLMRAMAARGERNRALRHYQAFEEWLAREIGADPDPETRALAEYLRELDVPAEQAEPSPAAPAEPPSLPAPIPTSAGATAAGSAPAAPAPAPEAVPGPPPHPVLGIGPERPRRRWTWAVGWVVVLAMVLLMVWMLAAAEPGTGRAAADELPGIGEVSPARQAPR